MNVDWACFGAGSHLSSPKRFMKSNRMPRSICARRVPMPTERRVKERRHHAASRRKSVIAQQKGSRMAD